MLMAPDGRTCYYHAGWEYLHIIFCYLLFFFFEVYMLTMWYLILKYVPHYLRHDIYIHIVYIPYVPFCHCGVLYNRHSNKLILKIIKSYNQILEYLKKKNKGKTKRIMFMYRKQSFDNPYHSVY